MQLLKKRVQLHVRKLVYPLPMLCIRRIVKRLRQQTKFQLNVSNESREAGNGYALRCATMPILPSQLVGFNSNEPFFGSIFGNMPGRQSRGKT